MKPLSIETIKAWLADTATEEEQRAVDADLSYGSESSIRHVLQHMENTTKKILGPISLEPEDAPHETLEDVYLWLKRNQDYLEPELSVPQPEVKKPLLPEPKVSQSSRLSYARPADDAKSTIVKPAITKKTIEDSTTHRPAVLPTKHTTAVPLSNDSRGTSSAAYTKPPLAPVKPIRSGMELQGPLRIAASILLAILIVGGGLYGLSQIRMADRPLQSPDLPVADSNSSRVRVPKTNVPDTQTKPQRDAAVKRTVPTDVVHDSPPIPLLDAATAKVRYASLKEKLRSLETANQNATMIAIGDHGIIEVIEESRLLEDQFSPADLREFGEVFLKTRKPDDTLGLLVPAYFDPIGAGGSNWGLLHAMATKVGAVPIIAIARPDDGPGEQPDAGYAAEILKSTRDDDKASYRVIGYVKCEGKSPTQVFGDVKRWVTHYPAIRGFYFDLHNATRTYAEQWKKVFDDARKLIQDKQYTEKPVIISNPKEGWDDDFYTVACPDIVCFGDKLPHGDHLPLWPLKHRGIALAAFYRIVVTENAQDIDNILKDTLARHLTWVYIGPKITEQLPNFLPEEVRKIRELNKKIKALKQ